MAKGGIRLLIADKDATVRDILMFGAREEKFEADGASDGIQALKLLKKATYNLAVLDAEMPQLGGVIVCRHLRKSSAMPVILTSGNGNEQNRIEAFQAGANDYVLKPFFPREVTLRIKSLLTLAGASPVRTKALAMGGVEIDPQARAVYVDHALRPLSPKEFDLLLCFARNPGQAFSRSQLLDHVWGQDFFGTERTVDTHVKSLRQKLAPYDGAIVTVWGYGYKFVVD